MAKSFNRPATASGFYARARRQDRYAEKFAGYADTWERSGNQERADNLRSIADVSRKQAEQYRAEARKQAAYERAHKAAEQAWAYYRLADQFFGFEVQPETDVHIALRDHWYKLSCEAKKAAIFAPSPDQRYL